VTDAVDAKSDASDASDASDDASDVSETIHKKPKFIFKSVRPDLEYAKILRGEYSLAYMLGEANEGGGGGGGSGTSCAPVAVAGGGRLMGQHQGQDVVIKSGKYGAYVVWGSTNISLKPLLGGGGGNVPSIPAPGAGKCSKYTPKSKTTTNQKSEFDLTLEDVVQFIERNSALVVVEDGDGEPSASASASASASSVASTGAYVQGQILRTIDENTTIRYGRYGPYIFHKTAKMSKPAFVALKGFPEKHGNYMTCEAAVIREWTAAKAAEGDGAPAKPKPKFGFFKKK
jgi:hypothetical protein